MFKMAYVLILCVILLVNQISMMPLDLIEDASRNVDMPALTVEDVSKNVKMPFYTEEEKLGAVKVTINPVEDVSRITKVPLSRVKRTVIGNTDCAKGYARMWHNGRCVTCEVYMNHMDTDECPGNSRR